jgi:putative sigma-54 modulation protein
VVVNAAIIASRSTGRRGGGEQQSASNLRPLKPGNATPPGTLVAPGDRAQTGLALTPDGPLHEPRDSAPSLLERLIPQPWKGHRMNLTISGHHLEVTPALREYVLTKLDRVTRHFDQVVDISVLLSIEKLKEKERRQKAEVTLHVKGRDIFIEQSHEDLYAAIDQLMDKLDRQVCRHKDRLQDHHHPAHKRIVA